MYQALTDNGNFVFERVNMPDFEHKHVKGVIDVFSGGVRKVPVGSCRCVYGGDFEPDLYFVFDFLGCETYLHQKYYIGGTIPCPNMWCIERHKRSIQDMINWLNSNHSELPHQLVSKVTTDCVISISKDFNEFKRFDKDMSFPKYMYTLPLSIVARITDEIVKDFHLFDPKRDYHRNKFRPVDGHILSIMNLCEMYDDVEEVARVVLPSIPYMVLFDMRFNDSLKRYGENPIMKEAILHDVENGILGISAYTYKIAGVASNATIICVDLDGYTTQTITFRDAEHESLQKYIKSPHSVIGLQWRQNIPHVPKRS